MTSRISLLIAVALVATSAVAQQSQNRPQSGGMAAPAPALPPALKAALLTGNPQAVRQAIDTLSQGNPTQAGNLAAQTVKAAEQMLATNPLAALSAAQEAVKVAQTPMVASAAPQAVQNIAVTALRIAVNPAAVAASPTQANELAAAARQLGAPAAAPVAPASSSTR